MQNINYLSLKFRIYVFLVKFIDLPSIRLVL